MTAFAAWSACSFSRYFVTTAPAQREPRTIDHGGTYWGKDVLVDAIK